VLQSLASSWWKRELLVRKASSDEAGFLKVEIAAATRCGRTDDDMIDQLKQQDSAGFENPPREPQIRFGRRWVAGYAACGGITGVGLNRFAVSGKSIFGDLALTNRFGTGSRVGSMCGIA
jgi:hypothetical protein